MIWLNYIPMVSHHWIWVCLGTSLLWDFSFSSSLLLSFRIWNAIPMRQSTDAFHAPGELYLCSPLCLNHNLWLINENISELHITKSYHQIKQASVTTWLIHSPPAWMKPISYSLPWFCLSFACPHQGLDKASEMHEYLLNLRTAPANSLIQALIISL